MANIVQGYPKARFASYLGAGLGEGLATLAEAKVQRMQEDQNIRQYTSAGVDPISARFIAKLPAEQRIPALGRYLEQGQGFPGEQQQYQQQEQYLPQPQLQHPQGGMQALQQPYFQAQPQRQGNIASLLENNYSSPIAPQFLEGLIKSPQQKQQVQQQQQALEQQQILANQAQNQPQQMQGQQIAQQPQPIAPAQPQQPQLNNQQRLARALGAAAPAAIEKQELAEQKRLDAKQRAINTQNAPFLKGITKAVDNAEVALDALQNMKKPLATDKVAAGIAGKFPTVLLNEESQLFDKYSNQLAQQLSGQTGIPTGFKIKFALTQKPNLEQKPETQKTLVDKLIKDAERVLQKGSIKDKIIEENGGEQPANLETLVNKRFAQGEKSGASTSDIVSDLSQAQDLEKGDQAINEETGETLEWNGKQWIRK